ESRHGSGKERRDATSANRRISRRTLTARHPRFSDPSMTTLKQKRGYEDNPRTVLHWYDFLCPFCYVGQHRTAILVLHGLHVVELPFQAHPDIPPGGIAAGPRNGPVYAMLEREAKEAGLPLHWPQRLPNTRRALAAAEWTRRHQPRAFHQLHKELFDAHFVPGKDIEDAAVIDRHASDSGIDLAALHAALADNTAAAAVIEAEMIGRKYGLQGK